MDNKRASVLLVVVAVVVLAMLILLGMQVYRYSVGSQDEGGVSKGYPHVTTLPYSEVTQDISPRVLVG